MDVQINEMKCRTGSFISRVSGSGSSRCIRFRSLCEKDAAVLMKVKTMRTRRCEAPCARPMHTERGQDRQYQKDEEG
jgi:hypothetical protein